MQEQSRWRKERADGSIAGKKDAAARRRRAHRHGFVAELIALVSLMGKGYRPLAWRFAMAGGEVDLIVRRGDVIAFVEVKARQDVMSAVHAIDRRKRERFCRTVRAWLQRHPRACGRSLRCDAVYIIRGWRPHHVEGAFELD